MSNIPFLNNASFSQDVGIGGEFTPNARLDIRDATNNILRIGTRGGTMDLFSVNNAGAAAPLNFEASEFNFLTGDVTFNNSIAVDKLVVIDSLNNSFIGEDSGKLNTTGFNNTAFGSNSLENNTTGSTNTAIGFNALFFNTTGKNNVALGFTAGISNTTGDKNIAIGVSAMGGLDGSRNEGDQNIAIGITALPRNTTGFFNIALGTSALSQNNTGQTNIGIGVDALGSNTTGSDNTGLGAGALQKNQTGSDNIAIGAEAGEFYYFNNGGSISQGNNTTPEKSIFIGSGTGPNSNGETNQIVIGDSAVGNGTNTVTLGNDNVTDTHLKGNVQTNGNVSATDGFFSGKVGIGTLIPNEELTIVGNGSSSKMELLVTGNTGSSQIHFGDDDDVNSGRIIYNHSSDDMEFNTNNTKALTLASDQSATFASSVSMELFNTSGGGEALNFRKSLGDANKYNMSITSFDHSGGGVGPSDGLSINGFDGVSISTGSSTSRQERFKIAQNGAATFVSSLSIAGASNSLALNAKGTKGFPNNSGTSQIGVFRQETLTSTVVMDSGVDGGSGGWIQVSNSNNLSLTYPLSIQPNGGYVGIGTNNAQGALSVKAGTFRQIDFIEENGKMTLKSTAPDANYNLRDLALAASSIEFRTGITASGNSTPALTISSNQSANFASSVTANGDLVANNPFGKGALKIRGNQSGAINYEISNAINGVANAGLQIINSNSNTKILTFNSANAATFASSASVGNDSAAASSTNQGAIRYRTSGNNSYVDMSMQTGVFSYMWINIVQNNW